MNNCKKNNSVCTKLVAFLLILTLPCQNVAWSEELSNHTLHQDVARNLTEIFAKTKPSELQMAFELFQQEYEIDKKVIFYEIAAAVFNNIQNVELLKIYTIILFAVFGEELVAIEGDQAIILGSSEDTITIKNSSRDYELLWSNSRLWINKRGEGDGETPRISRKIGNWFLMLLLLMSFAIMITSIPKPLFAEDSNQVAITYEVSHFPYQGRCVSEYHDGILFSDTYYQESSDGTEVPKNIYFYAMGKDGNTQREKVDSYKTEGEYGLDITYYIAEDGEIDSAWDYDERKEIVYDPDSDVPGTSYDTFFDTDGYPIRTDYIVNGRKHGKSVVYDEGTKEIDDLETEGDDDSAGIGNIDRSITEIQEEKEVLPGVSGDKKEKDDSSRARKEDGSRISIILIILAGIGALLIGAILFVVAIVVFLVIEYLRRNWQRKKTVESPKDKETPVGAKAWVGNELENAREIGDCLRNLYDDSYWAVYSNDWCSAKKDFVTEPFIIGDCEYVVEHSVEKSYFLLRETAGGVVIRKKIFSLPLTGKGILLPHKLGSVLQSDLWPQLSRHESFELSCRAERLEEINSIYSRLINEEDKEYFVRLWEMMGIRLVFESADRIKDVEFLTEDSERNFGHIGGEIVELHLEYINDSFVGKRIGYKKFQDVSISSLDATLLGMRLREILGEDIIDLDSFVTDMLTPNNSKAIVLGMAVAGDLDLEVVEGAFTAVEEACTGLSSVYDSTTKATLVIGREMGWRDLEINQLRDVLGDEVYRELETGLRNCGYAELQREINELLLDIRLELGRLARMQDGRLKLSSPYLHAVIARIAGIAGLQPQMLLEAYYNDLIEVGLTEGVPHRMKVAIVAAAMETAIVEIGMVNKRGFTEYEFPITKGIADKVKRLLPEIKKKEEIVDVSRYIKCFETLRGLFSRCYPRKGQRIKFYDLGTSLTRGILTEADRDLGVVRGTELGSVAEVGIDEFVLVEMGESSPQALYSATHFTCLSCEIRACKGDDIVIGHAHIRPGTAEANYLEGDVIRKLEMVLDYLTDDRNGFTNIQVILSPVQNMLSSGGSRELEDSVRTFGVQILPSVVRSDGHVGNSLNSPTFSIIQEFNYTAIPPDPDSCSYHVTDWFHPPGLLEILGASSDAEVMSSV